jgi:2-phospho-L-lactate guanylyltransferase
MIAVQAVLVPIKAFPDAKARLAGVLSGSERVRLAQWTAARVLGAAGELPVFVACDDEHVADWTRSRGATVLWHPGVGLNVAVGASIDALAADGFETVVVAHGDLPRPSPLAATITRGVITLVPDRHRDGTNVAAVPTASGFRFAYGPGSFRRHLQLAVDARLPVRVLADPLLALDIDTAADLTHPLVQEVLPEWLPTIPVNRPPGSAR